MTRFERGMSDHDRRFWTCEPLFPGERLRLKRMGEEEPAISPDYIEDISRREIIGIVTARLDQRLRGILEKRFLRGQTLEEVARFYGVEKERIRQLEARALRKARKATFLSGVST